MISAAERSVNEPPAKLTAAVRILTETYGLRVIVDSSPNSLVPVSDQFVNNIIRLSVWYLLLSFEVFIKV